MNGRRINLKTHVNYYSHPVQSCRINSEIQNIVQKQHQWHLKRIKKKSYCIFWVVLRNILGFQLMSVCYVREVLSMFNMFYCTEPRKIKGFKIKLHNIYLVFKDTKLLKNSIIIEIAQGLLNFFQFLLCPCFGTYQRI